MLKRHAKPILIRIAGMPDFLPTKKRVHSKHPAMEYQKKIREKLRDAGAIRLDQPIGVWLVYRRPRKNVYEFGKGGGRGFQSSLLFTVKSALVGPVIADGGLIQCGHFRTETGPLSVDIGIMPMDSLSVTNDPSEIRDLGLYLEDVFLLDEKRERRENQDTPHELGESRVVIR